MRARDHRIVAISDIEMGSGGPTDDFPHTAFLADLVRSWASDRSRSLDVVFNGDTFDFLKVPIEGTWPTLITEHVALAKLDRVFAAHGVFFDAVADLLRRDAPTRVHFIVGNHDQELCFSAVQNAIRARIGEQGVHFPGLGIDIGDARIEHGMQADAMFRIDPDRLFVDTDAGPVLALPWGTSALLDVAMPLYPQLCDLDRLRPRRRVFELVPEFRDFVVGAFWRYWTRDGWRDWIGGHPVKRIGWTMLREIAYRFGTLDPDVVEGSYYRAQLHRSHETRLIVAGHVHQAGWWSEADRKLLHTGCFRDEHVVEHDGRVGAQIPKTWADIQQRDGRTVGSVLVEVSGPPSPPGHVPDTVFDVLPRIRPLLGTREERARVMREEAAQRDQEDPGD